MVRYSPVQQILKQSPGFESPPQVFLAIFSVDMKITGVHAYLGGMDLYTLQARLNTGTYRPAR